MEKHRQHPSEKNDTMQDVRNFDELKLITPCHILFYIQGPCHCRKEPFCSGT